MNDIGIRDLDFPNIGSTLEQAKRYRANKQQAYKEGYEEFIKTSIPFIYNGVEYFAHPNINLYLDVCKNCNCDCKFCICKTSFERGYIDDDKYFKAFLEAVNILNPINPSVQIVGGEPTIRPYLLNKILTAISFLQIRNPVLGTNGYGLHGGLLERVKYSTLEHINISRHYYNEYSNRNIMNYHIDDMSNDELAEAAKCLRGVRVQCNLTGGEIDTYGEVMQFIAYAYHKLGVKTVSFAQLTPLPSGSFYDPSIIKYVAERPVDIDGILERIEKDNRFRFVKYRGGVACYYEIWEFNAYEKPMSIQFKFSDNNWLEKADNDPRAMPDVILHTDGSLCASWNKNKKLLAKLA